MTFALHEKPAGVVTQDGPRVVYDLDRGEASFGAARVDGAGLVWELGGDGEGAVLAAELDLDPEVDWVMRCDRVEFPAGSVAYRHVHPGPGIRRLLFGALTIEAEDGTHTYRAGDAWFEGADYPVLATASDSEDTAFVRVLLLPRVWTGKRTIRYLDADDEARPKRQRAEILLEEPLRL